MTIVPGSMAAGRRADRNGTGVVVESLQPDPQVQGRERELSENGLWILKPQSPPPGDTPPPKPHLLILLKQLHLLGAKYSKVRAYRSHSHSNHMKMEPGKNIGPDGVALPLKK